MDKGSPARIKEQFQKNMKRLQVRTHRDHHIEGIDLTSDKEEGLNRDNRANLLHVKEAELLLPLVVPPLLLQASWVTFAPGTLQTSGEKGGRKVLTGHTCGTSPSPLMSPPRKLTPSPLW